MEYLDTFKTESLVAALPNPIEGSALFLPCLFGRGRLKELVNGELGA